jgi:hypothetical protein
MSRDLARARQRASSTADDHPQVPLRRAYIQVRTWRSDRRRVGREASRISCAVETPSSPLRSRNGHEIVNFRGILNIDRRAASFANDPRRTSRSLRVARDTLLDGPLGAWPFAKVFATSRAHSMKRSTTGLKVRFFKVAIVISQGRMGSLTGSTFSEQKCGTDLAKVVRNGPLVVRQVHGEIGQAHRRHIESSHPRGLRHADAIPSLGSWQNPGLVDQPCKIDRAMARPAAVQFWGGGQHEVRRSSAFCNPMPCRAACEHQAGIHELTPISRTFGVSGRNQDTN